jgi:hypothetical protein
MEQPYIAESARRHGIADENMLHALNLPIAVLADDEGFTKVYGAARNGVTIIEIGYVVGEEDGAVVIVHAMETSDKRMGW